MSLFEYTAQQKIDAIYYIIAKLKNPNDQLELCYWFQSYFFGKYNHFITYDKLKYFIPEVFDTKFARKKYADSEQTFWWDKYNNNQKRINYLKGCLNHIYGTIYK